MKKLFVTLFVALIAISCGGSNSVDIVVANRTNIARCGEIVEIEANILSSKLGGVEQFIVRSVESGEVVASQLTYDEKLIFQSSVDAGAELCYRVEAGVPEGYKPLVFGKQYPERVDDFAWESDCIAFRTYGPALQASGERAFGYDVWVKNTTDLVVDRRYRKELDEGISYHVDHGDGLDCYKVGPTLGAGTTALMVGDEIIYPYCYKSYELLDSGALRLTFALEYNPIEVGEDRDVVERRVISIDAGSHLNRCLVTYSNLSKPATIITGLVMQDKEGVADYSADLESGYISYATNQGKNGYIYVASITPQKPLASEAIYFDPEESRKLRGGAKGHLVSKSKYEPNSTYEYYWGAGWSRFKFNNHDEWQSYLKEKIAQIESPLQVTIK
ncbi:MAG: DUF4861 domain-containing protein [Rikenellaceae bacterium]